MGLRSRFSIKISAAWSLATVTMDAVAQTVMTGKKLKVAVVMVNQYSNAISNCAIKAFAETRKIQNDWDISYVDFPADEVEAVKTAEKLVKSAPPDVVLGDHTSQHALALARVFNAHKTPYITTAATLPAITLGHPYVTRYTTDSDFNSKQIAKFVHRHLAAKSIAIIVDVSKPFSTGYATSVKDFARKEIPGVKVYVHEIISADKTITTLIDKVYLEKPEVIYAPIYAFEGVQLITALDRLKSTVPAVMHSATLGSKVPLPTSFPIYFMGGTDPKADSDKYADYTNSIAANCKGVEAVETKGNISVSSAWDSVSLLYEITKSNPKLRGRQLIKAFNARPHQGIGGLRVVDKHGSISQPTFFFELKNGESKYVTTIDN